MAGADDRLAGVRTAATIGSRWITVFSALGRLVGGLVGGLLTLVLKLLQPVVSLVTGLVRGLVSPFARLARRRT